MRCHVVACLAPPLAAFGNAVLAACVRLFVWKALTERRELAYTIRASWKTRDTTRQAIKGCRNLLSRRRKGQGPKDLMQTYIDRRSPSQVKVGHWGETRRGNDHFSSGLFIFGAGSPKAAVNRYFYEAMRRHSWPLTSPYGQHDHKPIFHPPDHDRYLIRFPAAPANVAQKRERAAGRAGKVAHEWIDEMFDKGSQAPIVFVDESLLVWGLRRRVNLHTSLSIA